MTTSNKHWFGLMVLLAGFLCGNSDSSVKGYTFVNPPTCTYGYGFRPFATDVVMDCSTTNANSNSTLYLKNKPVNVSGSTYSSNGSVYTIHKFGISQTGEYKCVAQSPSGQKINWKCYIIGFPDPVPAKIVTFPGNNSIHLKSSQEMIIPCSATGLPRPTIKWSKNGKELKDCFHRCASKEYSMIACDRGSFTKNVKCLRIASATYPGDEGKYTCTSSNGFGSPDSRTVRAVFPFTPQIDKSNKRVVAPINKAQYLSCKVIRGEPLPTFKWMYSLIAGCATLEKCQQFNKWQTIASNHLQQPPANVPTSVSNITIPASMDPSHYKCIATNSLGQDTHIIIFLRSTSSVGFQFLKEPFGFHDVAFGENYTIDCSTNGTNVTTSLYHKQGIAWENLPKAGLESQLIIKGDVYTILDFGISNSGFYQCRAIDASGEKIQWPTGVGFLLPDISMVPEATIIPRYAVAEGQNQNITCESARGTTLTWFRTSGDSDVQVPNEKTVIIVDTKGNTAKNILIIKNAKKSDSGTYKCVVTFRGKQRYVMTAITVFEKLSPKILSHTPSLDANILEDVKLECSIQAHPKPKVKWYKEDKEIKVSGCTMNEYAPCKGPKYTLVFTPIQKYKKYNTTLMISKLKYPDDHGMYHCKAENELATVEADMFVNIQIKPMIDKNAGLVSALVVYHRHNNPSYDVSCSAIRGNPPPVFTWEIQLSSGLGTKPRDDLWRSLALSFRHTITLSQDKMISTVTVARYITNAFYKCTTRNTAGEDSQIIHYFLRD